MTVDGVALFQDRWLIQRRLRYQANETVRRLDEAHPRAKSTGELVFVD